MECPVCLEEKPAGVAPWSCTHTTCAACCYEIVARRESAADCPLCRAALFLGDTTTYANADKFVMIAADGNALRVDHAARTVVAATAPNAGLREWLDMDGLCVAIRTDRDSRMRYMVSGTLADLIYLCLSPQ